MCRLEISDDATGIVLGQCSNPACGKSITLENAVLQTYKGRIYVRGCCRDCHNARWRQHYAENALSINQVRIEQRKQRKRDRFQAISDAVRQRPKHRKLARI